MKIEKKCPSCGVKTVYGEFAHFPFCSSRCRDKDFWAWSEGERTLSTPLEDADSSTNWEDLSE